VETILNSRKVGKGTQYLVKWRGFPENKATWEPSRNIDQATEALQEYHNKVKQEPRRKTIRRTTPSNTNKQKEELQVQLLSPKVRLPTRGSDLATGYDLSSSQDLDIPAKEHALVSTNLSISLPRNTYGRIAPRSGLALKHAISVGAGVIDADYMGPVGVILFNHGQTTFSIKTGDHIAQLILEHISTPQVNLVDSLKETVRGNTGFGSTGSKVRQTRLFSPKKGVMSRTQITTQDVTRLCHEICDIRKGQTNNKLTDTLSKVSNNIPDQWDICDKHVLDYVDVPCRFWVRLDWPNLVYDGNPRNRSRPSVRRNIVEKHRNIVGKRRNVVGTRRNS